MKIERLKYEDILILCPFGRIDALPSAVFEKALLEAIDEDPNLIIDLQETEYISSSGLRAFLAAL